MEPEALLETPTEVLVSDNTAYLVLKTPVRYAVAASTNAEQTVYDV